MPIDSKFKRQIDQLLETEFKATSVWGLKTRIKNPAMTSEQIAAYLDVPVELIIDTSDNSLLRPSSSLGKVLKNRILIEHQFARLGMVGPKWAAIKYGITSKSLINLLYHISKSSLGMRMHAEQVHMHYKRYKIIDELKTKHIVDQFLQHEETVIYTSTNERSDHLKELCDSKGIECERILDAHYSWLNRVRASIKKYKLEVDADYATTFCSYTGLPIAHNKAEYSNIPKPGILEPDCISWLALAENSALENICMIHDRNRYEDFLKYTFL